MKNSFLILILFNTLLYNIIYAQFFSLKPNFGYTSVQMDAINNDNQLRIDQLSAITGNSLPKIKEFKGNYSWGIQGQYQLERNYFLNIHSNYYRESIKVENDKQGEIPYSFQNQHRIEYFEICLGINYFFDYSSWKIITTYIGAGGGFGIGWTEVYLEYNDGLNRVNNKGDFSSNSIVGYICAGLPIKFTSILSLVPEIGFRYANLGKMNGKLYISQNFSNFPDANLEVSDNNYTTEDVYDFSGFYGTIGIKILLLF